MKNSSNMDMMIEGTETEEEIEEIGETEETEETEAEAEEEEISINRSNTSPETAMETTISRSHKNKPA